MPIVEHPQRKLLNDEVHARPPEPIKAPCRISYLALYSDWTLQEQDIAPLIELAKRFNIEPPPTGTNHFIADLGNFRLKWERHTEFTRYTFYVDGVVEENAEDQSHNIFTEPAISVVPADWLQTLPGNVMIASHAVLLDSTVDLSDYDALSQKYFAGNVLIGSAVAGGQGMAITDFQVQSDGFSRLIVQDRGMTARQNGRTLQRLFELDTYRMMALMALPVARELSPILTEREQEVAAITTAMATASEEDETDLLDRLTRLQAAIESRHAKHHYRFSASQAYYEIVQRRIEELREERIEGLSIFREFIERRLAPAMSTCETMEMRQNTMSQRVARASQLLSTRVEMGSRRQNQEVLESLNKRAKLQLRLQETVEGLSIAAVTYYVVGVIGYGAKGLKASGYDVNVELVMGVSVPVVIVLMAFAVRKVRNLINFKKKRETQNTG
jgi:uncharacterized membrane-anchored protein